MPWNTHLRDAREWERSPQAVSSGGDVGTQSLRRPPKSIWQAFLFGTPDFPLDVPLQTIIDRVEDGTYKAKPAKVFGFHEIQDAHRLMESYQSTGKVVVKI